MSEPKRPENIRRMWEARWHSSESHRRNVWLGTSISNQTTADKMVPELLMCRDLSPVLFLSCEPLLGPIRLRTGIYSMVSSMGTKCTGLGPALGTSLDGIGQVITGGESGPNARDCNIDWIRSIGQECQTADVAWFNKQLGARVVDHDATAAHSFPESQCWPDGTKTDGHRVLLKNPKGGDMSEWPEDLRVRQFPQ